MSDKKWFIMYLGCEGSTFIDHKLYNEEDAREIYNKEASDGCCVGLYCLTEGNIDLKEHNFEMYGSLF